MKLLLVLKVLIVEISKFPCLFQEMQTYDICVTMTTTEVMTSVSLISKEAASIASHIWEIKCLFAVPTPEIKYSCEMPSFAIMARLYSSH